MPAFLTSSCHACHGSNHSRSVLGVFQVSSNAIQNCLWESRISNHAQKGYLMTSLLLARKSKFHVYTQ